MQLKPIWTNGNERHWPHHDQPLQESKLRLKLHSLHRRGIPCWLSWLLVLALCIASLTLTGCSLAPPATVVKPATMPLLPCSLVVDPPNPVLPNAPQTDKSLPAPASSTTPPLQLAKCKSAD